MSASKKFIIMLAIAFPFALVLLLFELFNPLEVHVYHNFLKSPLLIFSVLLTILGFTLIASARAEQSLFPFTISRLFPIFMLFIMIMNYGSGWAISPHVATGKLYSLSASPFLGYLLQANLALAEFYPGATVHIPWESRSQFHIDFSAREKGLTEKIGLYTIPLTESFISSFERFESIYYPQSGGNYAVRILIDPAHESSVIWSTIYEGTMYFIPESLVVNLDISIQPLFDYSAGEERTYLLVNLPVEGRDYWIGEGAIGILREDELTASQARNWSLWTSTGQPGYLNAMGINHILIFEEKIDVEAQKYYLFLENPRYYQAVISLSEDDNAHLYGAKILSTDLYRPYEDENLVIFLMPDGAYHFYSLADGEGVFLERLELAEPDDHPLEIESSLTGWQVIINPQVSNSYIVELFSPEHNLIDHRAYQCIICEDAQ